MLIGRETEITTLTELYESDESEMVSVIGRRRVGKTFLVQSFFKDKIDFEITGIQSATRQEQLKHFATVLNLYYKSSLPLEIPKDWLDAFRLLILYLENKNKNGKQVVFFDELPWLATHRSGFLKAFGFFWNSWAVKNNVVVIICGSAASWMIRNVVNNKGGLYNRITKRLHLHPFTLNETERYLQHRKMNFTRYQIVEFYLTMGGIPHYLKEIQTGCSVAQNIDRICFNPSGSLYDEFKNLYPSLFDNYENHVAVVRALSKKWSGLNRKEILKGANMTNGGGATKVMEELMHSGFIDSYFPFGNKKQEMRFRLTDEYSLFYLKFIETLKKEGAGVWASFQQSQIYRSWSGYAFESLCMKHLQQIKKGLDIAGIYSTSASFYKKGNDEMDGCQIDLLIDRNDNVINLCEIKFSATEFEITKKYAADLRRKIVLFKAHSKTKKQILLTFISPYGVLPNKHSSELVDSELTLDNLFKKL